MTKIARKLNHNSMATRLEQIYRGRDVLKLDSSDADVLRNLGEVLLELKRFDVPIPNNSSQR